MKNKISYTTAIAIIVLIIVGSFVYFDYKEKNSTEWKTYTSEQFGFSFEYPTRWGDVLVHEIPKSEDMSIYFSYDLKDRVDQVTQDQYEIRFENKQCNIKEYCSIYFSLLAFSPEKPLEALCEEGDCFGFENLVDDRIYVNNYSSEFIDNKPAYCEEKYNSVYNTTYKVCRIYHNDTRIRLGYTYYLLGDFKVDYNDNTSSLTKKPEDSNDFNQFVNDYDRLLHSVTFLN